MKTTKKLLYLTLSMFFTLIMFSCSKSSVNDTEFLEKKKPETFYFKVEALETSGEIFHSKPVQVQILKP